ncbi:hypothetical protein [Hymenobacter metallilatus]|uniref:Uncharacterized protein n=1 Tax=Hymenobacter metallilatus TaxID=2493666 RepID=A0A428IYI2_9BACT|nr:hypothetical protein [Hymenobacter metallilatus]RSK24207.1 hypothetical protein EI290_20725 [Hymenobacter metallilatus]
MHQPKPFTLVELIPHFLGLPLPEGEPALSQEQVVAALHVVADKVEADESDNPHWFKLLRAAGCIWPQATPAQVVAILSPELIELFNTQPQ